MKRILKILQYLYPAILGLVIYFTVRLITDSANLNNHFLIDWRIWASEITFFILTGYFYVFVIKRFNKRKNVTITNDYKIKTIVKEFALFCLYIFLITNATLIIGAAFTDDGLDWHDFIVLNLIPLFYCFIIFLVLRVNVFLKAYINNRLQLERLARDKAEEEIKFLKGQYQPHFLFNALNTVYFQMDESVDAAKQSIEKLSDLLRYRLYDDDSVKVLLAKEIEYLKKYIQFQAIRSSESLKITTKFDQAHNGEQVYPFLFLPCIENAFKYVSGEMWIDIALSVKNLNIEFVVSNSIDSKVLEMSKNRGIGLQNLEKRLALLYKNKYSFEVRTNENKYEAMLLISLA